VKNRLLLGGVFLSFAWNFYLVLGAALNNRSILTRVAGGGFDSMPMGLRVAYGIQSILIIYQIYFVAKLYQRNGAWSKNSYLLARIFMVLSGVSTFVNAISRSSAERWNAIAALIITVGFYFLGNVNLRPTK
jgi:hypothetical protein